MRNLSTAAVCSLVIALGVALAGCQQIGSLQGKMAFRDANAKYQAQDYRTAAAKYEEAVAADPNLTAAYFFLGNSYDNLYKPTRKGEPENDALLTKAIDNYKRASEMEPDPKIKNLALQYLVAAYGADKLNDAGQAMPVVQRMIELDPKEPANYFALAKIYEENGDYEQAEQTLMRAKEARATDPAVYLQLAGFYNRQGEFEKTIDALQQRTQHEPNNPEAYYTIATYYWEKAYRDFRLSAADQKNYVQAGVESVDKAISLKDDYQEALVYKNLLLRLQANLEKDAGKQQALLKEANRLRDRAEEIRKAKTAGVGD